MLFSCSPFDLWSTNSSHKNLSVIHYFDWMSNRIWGKPGCAKFMKLSAAFLSQFCRYFWIRSKKHPRMPLMLYLVLWRDRQIIEIAGHERPSPLYDVCKVLRSVHLTLSCWTEIAQKILGCFLRDDEYLVVHSPKIYTWNQFTSLLNNLGFLHDMCGTGPLHSSFFLSSEYSETVHWLCEGSTIEIRVSQSVALRR